MVSVRLVGSSAEYMGRVEFFYNNQWGTVCDKRWGIPDGTVVCRQLGFINAIRVFTAGGGGNGTIWLTKLGCIGNESSLLECQNAKVNLGKSDCSHQQDAGVECNQTRIGKLSVCY